MISTYEYGIDGGESLRNRLQQVDPSIAELRRIAFSGRGTVRFSFGGAPFALHLVDDETDFEPAIALLLQAGQAQGWMLLESCAPAGEEWSGVFERLDPVLVRALLIESASRQFEQLAAASGQAVRLVDLLTGPVAVTQASAQAMRLVNEQTGIGVRAALRADNPEFFTHVAAALKKCAPVPGVPPATACLPLRLSLGVARMSPHEARQSRPGDVLVFPVDGSLEAVHAVCLEHRGRLLPLKVLLSGSSGRITYSQEEIMMNEQNDMQPVPGASLPLEEVSVPVTAVIGTLEIPLSAVGSLQSGYLFELPGSVEHAVVQLYTGTRRVGSGRLVAIGERLGVRLVEWKGDRHDTAA